MEKIKLERLNKKTLKKETVEIYDSFSPARLENETREEYKVRRELLNELYKLKKTRREMVHKSSNLIPLTNEEGKVLIVQGKPIYIGKTKGITYKKEEKNGN